MHIYSEDTLGCMTDVPHEGLNISQEILDDTFFVLDLSDAVDFVDLDIVDSSAHNLEACGNKLPTPDNSTIYSTATRNIPL